MTSCLPCRSPARLSRRYLLAASLGLCASTAAWAGEAPADPAPPISDETLLLHACAYLKLSRTQMTRLLPYARITDNAVEAFKKAETELRASLGDPNTASPEAAKAIEAKVSGRRATLHAQISELVLPNALRLLTREQMGLAYRLAAGSPPAYARAHPQLVGSGLFSDPAAIRRNETILGGVRPFFDLQRASDLIVEDAPAISRLQGALGRIRTPVAGRSGKPIPQLLAESNDAAELGPLIQPLIVRLFAHEGWFVALRAGLRSGLPGVQRNPTAPPLRLVRDYRLERGFRDLRGVGVSLEPMGGVLDHGHYVFGPGQGLKLEGAGVTDHYAIQIDFQHEGAPEYRKLIDFSGGTKDIGLYTYQGQVTFYTLAVGGSPQPGSEHRLRIERNRSTRIVTVSLDLKPIFAFLDLDGDAILDGARAILFADDRATGREQGPGAVKSVAVWGPQA